MFVIKMNDLPGISVYDLPAPEEYSPSGHSSQFSGFPDSRNFTSVKDLHSLFSPLAVTPPSFENAPSQQPYLMLSSKETIEFFCLAPKAEEKAFSSPRDKDVNFDVSGIVICSKVQENDEHKRDDLAMDSNKVEGTLDSQLRDRDLFSFSLSPLNLNGRESSEYISSPFPCQRFVSSLTLTPWSSSTSLKENSSLPSPAKFDEISSSTPTLDFLSSDPSSTSLAPRQESADYPPGEEDDINVSNNDPPTDERNNEDSKDLDHYLPIKGVNKVIVDKCETFVNAILSHVNSHEDADYVVQFIKKAFHEHFNIVKNEQEEKFQPEDFKSLEIEEGLTFPVVSSPHQLVGEVPQGLDPVPVHQALYGSVLGAEHQPVLAD